MYGYMGVQRGIQAKATKRKLPYLSKSEKVGMADGKQACQLLLPQVASSGM